MKAKVTINVKDRTVDWGFDERSNELIEYLPGAIPPIIVSKVPSGSHFQSRGVQAYSKTGYRVAALKMETATLSPRGSLVIDVEELTSFDARPTEDDVNRMWTVMGRTLDRVRAATAETAPSTSNAPLSD